MADTEQKVGLIQILAVLFVAGLFVADYGFDGLAKQPPNWAYWVPGLLALGIEAGALRRLIVQIIRAAARLPQDPEDRK